MSVHYKFKTALDYDTVTFDGLHISVRDLKKQILQQKKIGKSTDFDLQITNAQTKETYTNEDELISKNTSLIVARVPLTVQQKKQWDRDNQPAGGKDSDLLDGGVLGKSVDIAALDLSEDDKIKTMMSQSTSDYDPSKYVKVKGGNQVGAVPANYVCYKCHKRGHWIKDCTVTSAQLQEGVGLGEAIRKNSGIPRSFMIPVEGPQVPGARMTPTGGFAVPAIDHEVYKEKKIEKPPFLAEKEKPAEQTPIPDDLVCGICKDLLQDAVMAPCCGNSFCDECLRGVLVESELSECPECNEKDVSPDTLIPNRFLRNSVNNFKNKTGYVKKPPVKEKGQTPPRPTLPDFVPPDENLKKTDENEVAKQSDSQNKDGATMLYNFEDEKSSGNDSAPKLENGKEEKKDGGDEENKVGEKKKVKSDRDKDDIDDVSPVSSKGSIEPTTGENIGTTERVYTIQSIIPGRPPTIIDSSHLAYPPPRTMPPFIPGGERSGTPTVDERYDTYSRPPMPQFLPYNPTYPPPGGAYAFGMGYRGHHTQPFRGRYNGRPLQPGPMHQNTEEDGYLAWMNWMQQKDERSKRARRSTSRGRRSTSRSRRSGSRGRRSLSRSRRSTSRSRRSRSRRSSSRGRRSPSRSRSLSIGRVRSYSSKRSRTRSRTPRRSLSRKRTRSRSRSRSFLMSRSRSRSFARSPIDRKKHSPPPRSPHRGERFGEHYGADESYGWGPGYRGSRGGYRSRGRYNSPPRTYPTYTRYRDDYGAVSPRNYGSPKDYIETGGRAGSPRWNDNPRSRSRKRSRSGSAAFRGHYDERNRRSRSLERRSPVKNRRERSPLRETSRRDRDRRSMDRNGRNISRDRSPEFERDRKRRDFTPDRSRSNEKKREKEHSRSLSRRRSVSRRRSRDKGKRSQSPRRSKSRKRSTSIDEKRGTSKRLDDSQLQRMIDNERRDDTTSQDRIQMATGRNPSPESEKTRSSQKKEKKKDKEKKKRKKEKETDEEREARKKRKKEKKEEKKRKEISSAKTDVEVNAEMTEDVSAADVTEAEKEEQPSGSQLSVPVSEKSPSAVRAATPNSAGDATPELLPENSSSYMLERTPSPARLIADVTEPGELPEEGDVSTPAVLAPVPELSRWEIEDGGLYLPSRPRPASPDALPRVTSEVLKRAENAIFKKAISAIRDPSKRSADSPERTKKNERETEVKDGNSSGTRAKSKENTAIREKDRSHRVTAPKKPESRKGVNSIQITIPVTSEKEDKEREVGFTQGDKTTKPKVMRSPINRVSIKDRLGDRLGSKVELSPRNVISSVVARCEDRPRPTISSAVEAIDSKRAAPIDESHFVPNYDESSDEDGKTLKSKRSHDAKKQSKVVDVKKRVRSSSETSEEKAKSKKRKNKKEKKVKKRQRKDLTESESESDSESERKKHKRAKKKKKSRH